MPHTRRFADRKDAKELIKKSTDFHHREYGVPITVVALFFVGVLLITLWLISGLLTEMMAWPSKQDYPLEKIQRVLIAVTVFSVVAGSVATIMLFKIRHVVVATEFQSLIFSSCMRIDSEFVIIVHKDKKGIYCDYNFSKMFAHIDNKSDDPLHILMASQGFTPGEEKELLDAIDKGTAQCFEFAHKSPEGKVEKLQLSLDPIDRPKGFFLIRGHKEA